MNEVMLISDAAKEVNVENHVLRYWEEELHLPIKRNELGHRYYTNEDIERFKQIKSMKERGLQLKAIKMILKNGKIDILSQHEVKKNDEVVKSHEVEKCDEIMKEHEGLEDKNAENNQLDAIGQADIANQGKSKKNESAGALLQSEDADVHMAIDIVNSREIRRGVEQNQVARETKEDKARRLQWLLQQLIRETLQENNQQLCNDIKESVVKELDYQFRAQEERDEERDRRQTERNDEYYKKMDELLRLKREKKKRHFIF